MKKCFHERCPPLLQIDCTYNFDTSNYKLCGFVYLDCETNSSKLAGIGYMDRECKENLSFLFNQLKEISTGCEAVIIVDKDFTQLSVLQEVFAACTILLCVFHVIQYMQRVIGRSCNANVDEKSSLNASFSKLLYSRSEEEYKLRNAAFKNEAAGVSVLPPGNQDYEELSCYYSRNWESCPEMWVMFHRRALPTLSDNTNNRVER